MQPCFCVNLSLFLTHLDPFRRPFIIVVVLRPRPHHLRQEVLRLAREQRGEGEGGGYGKVAPAVAGSDGGGGGRGGVRGWDSPPEPLDRHLGLCPPLRRPRTAAALAAQTAQPFEQRLRVPLPGGLERRGQEGRGGGAEGRPGRGGAGDGGSGVLFFPFLVFPRGSYG